jgi:hypothetical protein
MSTRLGKMPMSGPKSSGANKRGYRSCCCCVNWGGGVDVVAAAVHGTAAEAIAAAALDEDHHLLDDVSLGPVVVIVVVVALAAAWATAARWTLVDTIGEGTRRRRIMPECDVTVLLAERIVISTGRSIKWRSVVHSSDLLLVQYVVVQSQPYPLPITLSSTSSRSSVKCANKDVITEFKIWKHQVMRRYYDSQIPVRHTDMHELNSIEVDCDPMMSMHVPLAGLEMAGLEKRWHVAKKAALDLLYRANIHRCCSSNLDKRFY